MPEHERVVDIARRGLLACRNNDGGWGYYASKKSRLEATAMALITLSGHELKGDPAVLTLLRKWQGPDGLLRCVPRTQANLAFNGIAALALLNTHGDGDRQVPPMLGRLLPALSRAKGSKTPLAQRIVTTLLPGRRTTRQNDELQGWSWLPGNFSWVEPTAWCLLAVKKARKQLSDGDVDPARIDEGEQLLCDRCCVTGGWNYGNSNVLGRTLRAYVPTTAIALLAMQDRKGIPEVGRSVEFLRRNALSERSTSALALASLALRIHGLDTTIVDAALIEQLGAGRLPNNNVSRALASSALDGGRGALAFTL